MQEGKNKDIVPQRWQKPLCVIFLIRLVISTIFWLTFFISSLAYTPLAKAGNTIILAGVFITIGCKDKISYLLQNLRTPLFFRTIAYYFLIILLLLEFYIIYVFLASTKGLGSLLSFVLCFSIIALVWLLAYSFIFFQKRTGKLAGLASYAASILKLAKSFISGFASASAIAIIFINIPFVEIGSYAKNAQIRASASYEEAMYCMRNGDFVAGEKKLITLADDNNDAAAATLGSYYLAGDTLDRNLEKAMYYFRKGADLGNDSCVYIYSLMLARQGRFELSRKYSEMLADSFPDKRNELLGNYYLYGPKPDYSLALSSYTAGAILGNKYCMNQLGLMYFYGVGVPASIEEAKQHFLDAFSEDRNDGVASCYLGIIYLQEQYPLIAKDYFSIAMYNGIRVIRIPVTKEQQQIRHNLYQDAVKTQMFQDATPSEQEFNRRIDHVSDYVDKIYQNYKDNGGDFGSAEKLRQYLGAPYFSTIPLARIKTMPLTEEQISYRHKFYHNAKNNDMFLENRNMSEKEFNYLLDHVSDYAGKVYNNYVSLGAHLGGSFEAFRQKIGAPYFTRKAGIDKERIHYLELLTKEQQQMRQRLYKDAVDNNMFTNGTVSYEEFNRRIDHVSDYVDKVADNYRSHGVDLGDGNLLRQGLGVFTTHQITNLY